MSKYLDQLTLNFETKAQRDYVLEEVLDSILTLNRGLVDSFKEKLNRKSVTFFFRSEEERDAVVLELCDGVLGRQLELLENDENEYDVFIVGFEEDYVGNPVFAEEDDDY